MLLYAENANKMLEPNADGNGDKTVGESDVQMEDGPSRPEGALRFEVQNFSKIKETVLSDHVMIRNLQWYVCTRINTV